jgi:hypothetical protein
MRTYWIYIVFYDTHLVINVLCHKKENLRGKFGVEVYNINLGFMLHR